MDKKTLIIYVSGGIIALLAIIFTVIFALSLGNKPVNICTTILTENMADKLLEGFCGETDKKYIKNKKIKDAYLSLIDDSIDVVLTTGINDEVIKQLRLSGVEIETISIAKDALVFINNVDNPINNLTSNQVKGIYSGKDINWSNFNGKDEEIIAYPPVHESEEVYMMEEFMGDKAIKKPKYRLENNTLDSLIKAVSDYLDTRTKAIFYTTFHNIKDNRNTKIKVLNIDGIEVSEETIKAGRYPVVMDIYAVIRSDIPENSQTRKFVEYIRSKDGQAIIEQCGYVNLIK